MRPLTQTEIDNAPDWAINYVMSDDNRNIRWQDEVTFKWHDCEFRQAFSGKPLNDFKPIPRKEFDIVEYEFSDSDIEVISNASHRIKIRSNHSAGFFYVL